MTMTLKNYLDLLATKIDEAILTGDSAEIIRLCQLGRDLFGDEIDKRERHLQQQEGKVTDAT